MRLRLALSIILFAGCGGSGAGGAICPKGQVKFDEVCLTAPTVEAERTACGDITEFCDKTATKAPMLGCLTAKQPAMRPGPGAVALTGYIHPFSGGSSNSIVSV